MFFYAPDRKGDHPQGHWKGFIGVLHADGHAGFNAMFEADEATQAACWALVARKFLDEHADKPSANTAEALDCFGTLYRIEDTIRSNLPDERWRVRQDDDRPRLDKQKTWIQATIPSLSAKTKVAKAMRYALGRWSALGR